MVTLYHVGHVFGVAVKVMINKSSFAVELNVYLVSTSPVYVTAYEEVVATTERAPRLVSSGSGFIKFSTNQLG